MAPTTLPTMTAARARRLAVAAQGFRSRPASVGPAALRRLLLLLGAVQIDAVNVLVRSHYLPFFSRLGRYDVGALDRLVHGRRQAFEYWAHAASLVPIELYPLLAWRRDAADRSQDAGWDRFLGRVERERPGYAAAVLAEVAERGPLTFSELTDPARRPRGNRPGYAASTMLWDRGSDGKTVLEYYYDTGRLAVESRRGFDRRFDLAERVIPADARAEQPPERATAERRLVELSVRALGVAALPEIRDYFRLAGAGTRAAVAALVADGVLQPVRVEGWPATGYRLTDPPRAAAHPGCALLSPFDSLLWHRERVQRVFGFTHSFEIYVPEGRREFGYYVLPILLGDDLVGRLDLKADRAGGTLQVKGAYAEPGVAPGEVAGPVATEVAALAGWLGLDDVTVTRRGGLATALRAAL